MKTRKIVFLPLLALILAIISSAAANGVPSDEDLKDMIKEFDDANADAAKNIPGTRTKKAVEDKLDQAEQNVDDAQRALDKLNEKDNPNASQIAAAKKRLATAEAQRDKAKDLADEVKSRFPDKDKAYRDALERRRKARKKLKEAHDAMGPAMRGLGRPAVEDKVRRIRRKLGEANDYPSFSLLGALPLGELNQSGLINCQVIGKGQTTGVIAEIKITNNGSEALKISIPPMILISQSGESQNYAAPIPQVAEVSAGKAVSVPIQGVCINRSRPPGADGKSGGMILQDINATVLTPAIEVSDPDQAEEAKKLDNTKVELDKKLADATAKNKKASNEFHDFMDGYVKKNKELTDKVLEKYKEHLETVRNRTIAGAEEREKVYEDKGLSGKAEMQELLNRQIEDIKKLEDEFNDWQISTIEEAIEKQGGQTHEDFIKKRRDYLLSEDEVIKLKIEKEQLEKELKKVRDPKNQEYDTDQTQQLLTAVTSVYEAVEELQKEGELEKMPYPNPEKQREIALQWGTWASEEISQSTGETPATKEDIAEVIEKQVAEKTDLTPEVKENLQPGIDNIWAVVELTGTKAKSLTEDQYKEPEED